MSLDPTISRLEDVAREAQEKSQIPEHIEILATSVRDACSALDKAWSGSCLGRAARMYIREFQPRSAQDFFDETWGFLPYNKTRGDWHVYSEDEIRGELHQRIGTDDLKSISQCGDNMKTEAERLRARLCGALDQAYQDIGADRLKELSNVANQLEVQTSLLTVASRAVPSDHRSRDQDLVLEGVFIPCHLSMSASVDSHLSSSEALQEIARIAKEAASYLRERRSPKANGGTTWPAWTNPLFLLWKLLYSPVTILILMFKEPARLWPKVVISLVIAVCVTAIAWTCWHRFLPTVKPEVAIPTLIAIALSSLNIAFNILKEFKGKGN